MKRDWRCALEQWKRGWKSYAGFVHVISHKCAPMMKIPALLSYPIHIVMLNSSAVYCQWLAESRLNLVGFLTPKMDKCKDSELNGGGWGKCAHYLFIVTEKEYAVEGRTGLRQSTPSQFQSCLSYEALSEVIEPCCGFTITYFGIKETKGRTWGYSLGPASYCHDIAWETEMEAVKHRIALFDSCLLSSRQCSGLGT